MGPASERSADHPDMPKNSDRRPSASPKRRAGGRTQPAPQPLPEPSDPILQTLLRDTTTRLIYGFLFNRRQNPPTMVEIRAFLARELGEAPAQTDRRVRDLRDAFEVPSEYSDGGYRYVLRGWRPGGPLEDRSAIGGRLRAEVLSSRRCAQCGRTPLDHGVVLVVDHMIPREWGGSNDRENLQPLCEECNHGKRDLYSSYDAAAPQIRKAITHDEPHRRIGELLKAFGGDWVPGTLLGVVASAVQYQEDWQKRTRELRTLDWVIETQKRRDITGRVHTYYRASHWEPWPPGDIRAEIRRRERSARSA
jgi:5-methylcytosine-specific restriction endonuclease McrA